jgi:hypothetical protein
LSAAQRSALRRQRARRGEVVLHPVVPEVPLVERLIAAGLVEQIDYEDKRKITAALETVILTWCGVTRADIDF